MEIGDRVRVREGQLIWFGTFEWTEESPAGTWAVIRPENSGTHVRRGSGSRECWENLVRVPTFFYTVEAAV